VSALLAPYACWPDRTRGRRFPEDPTSTRSDYQRDRDRIVHSTAFRRLGYKTQVFLNHEGDLFRTRMTHSLEVAQLARSIARALRLNEDLVEAIALAHDLGHTPFGHAGQEALNNCMAAYGGFEHNLQSLRVVDELEERYGAYDGLNLTFEAREGILKHCARSQALALEASEPPYPDALGGVGRRFLEHRQPSLEAQLCNLADQLAYNAHDIDDGVRSGLIGLEQLQALPVWQTHQEAALRAHPALGQAHQRRRLLYETVRRMLSAQVDDVIASTQAAIAQHAPQSASDVRAGPPLLVCSPAMQEDCVLLKQFLFRQLYRHPRVEKTMDIAKAVVCDLFVMYVDAPHEMQGGGARRSRGVGGASHVGMQRVVADYIAGMTDRFASREHARLTGQQVLV
jgi:dGTPase